MNPHRHARDAAWQLSTAVCRVFAPLLRDEEPVDAHREVFDVLLPGLEDLLARYDRERARLMGPPPVNPPPQTA